MPHWNLGRNVLDSMAYELAKAVAPERSYRPQDAQRLVAIGRAIANLARLTWDEPEFQTGLNDTRLQLANQVTAVFAEADRESGAEPVDPELLAALTDALALAFGDPRPWGGA
jgi:hypothetical protein